MEIDNGLQHMLVPVTAPVEASIYNYGIFTNGGVDDDFITLLIGDNANSNFLFINSPDLT